MKVILCDSPLPSDLDDLQERHPITKDMALSITVNKETNYTLVGHSDRHSTMCVMSPLASCNAKNKLSCKLYNRIIYQALVVTEPGGGGGGGAESGLTPSTSS